MPIGTLTFVFKILDVYSSMTQDKCECKNHGEQYTEGGNGLLKDVKDEDIYIQEMEACECKDNSVMGNR
jgi:hypothetical protein